MTAKLSRLLPVLSHHDKDERWMGANDLTQELEHIEGVVEATLQVPVRNALLKLLEDPSADVQTKALQCLTTFVRKVGQEQVVEIIDRLAALCVDPQRKESRDIYAIGLRTLIGTLSEDRGEAVAPVLARKLLGGLGAGGEAELEEACLEVLKELLTRFGSAAQAMHDDILAAVVQRLEHKVESTRKRASGTLGALVVVLHDKPLASLMDAIIAAMDRVAGSPHLLFTYIQTIGVISQSAGSRMGRHLPNVMPLLEKFCTERKGETEGAGEREDGASEALMELWENCLHAFEAILTRCPQEVSPWVDSIIGLALHFIAYDPNFQYDDEADGEEAAGSGAEDADARWDDEEDAGWGNDDEGLAEQGDDDSSWKVRRAAVLCIAAFIKARTDLLSAHYDKLCDALIGRLKERDSKVKLNIFSALVDLVHGSVVAVRDPSASAPASASAGWGSAAAPALVRQRSSMPILVSKTPVLLVHLNREMKRQGQEQGKGAAAAAAAAEVRRAGLSVMRELVTVRQGGLGGQLALIMPHVLEAAKAEDVRLKGEGLQVARLIVQAHSAEDVAPYAREIAHAAVHASRDSYLKTKAEALRLCESLAGSLPGDEEGKATAGCSRDLVGDMYSAVMATLSLKDMDAEVKDASMSAMATLIARFGKTLAAHLPDTLPLIQQRLANEVTRMSSLRALARIASSPLRIDLSPVLEPTLTELCTLLRKDSQQLKQQTVVTLDAVIAVNGKDIPTYLIEATLKEVTPYMSDADLHLSHLVLSLATTLTKVAPTASALSPLVERAIALATSPLLQGAALASLTTLIRTLITTKAKEASWVVERLMSRVNPGLHAAGSAVIAQCVSAALTASEGSGSSALVASFVRRVQESKDDANRETALRVLGELGVNSDLAAHKDLEGAVLGALESPSESVKQAAAFALGSIAAGNLETYLPSLMAHITAGSGSGSGSADRKYLLLSALRHLIARHAAAEERKAILQPKVAQILPVLLDNTENKEEGVQSMVAECLGGLAAVQPDAVLPPLARLVSSDKPATRAVVATSLRFALLPSSADVPPQLRESLPAFLVLLNDSALTVRRQATVTVAALAHVLPSPLIKNTVLPTLYQSIKPDEKHVRIVDLGPFKHRVDDGLPLRKAAFQCLDTLLDVAPHRIDIAELTRNIQIGLADTDDIQIITYQILHNLAHFHPAKLLEVLDELPDGIMKAVKAKLKDAKSEDPQVVERAKDVLRSAVRSLAQMQSMHNIENCPKFVEFWLRVQKTQLLAELLRELQ